MTDELYLSASKIDTFLSCPRKYAFQHLQNLTTTQAKSAALGEAVHFLLEQFGKGLDPFNPLTLKADGKAWDAALSEDEKATAKKLLDLAVKEGFVQVDPTAHYEKQFKLNYAGATFTGYIDVQSEIKDNTVLITDYKTCKDTRFNQSDDPDSDKYLANAWQMRLYCIKAALNDFKTKLNPDSTFIIRHIYLVTAKDKEKVKSVSVTLKTADIAGYMGALATIVKQMKAVVELPASTQDELPKTVEDACEKYGGCHFAAICCGLQTKAEYVSLAATQTVQTPQTPKPQGTTKMSTSPLSPFARRVTQVAAQTPATIAPVTAPAPAVAATPLTNFLAEVAAAPAHVEVSAALIPEAIEAAPAPVKLVSPFVNGDRVTYRKEHGVYVCEVSDTECFIKLDKNESRRTRASYSDLTALTPEAEKKPQETTEKEPKNEIKDENAKVVGEVAPVLESEADEVHPSRQSVEDSVTFEEPVRFCAPDAPGILKPSITLFFGCVPQKAYITTSSLISDENIVGKDFFKRNAFERRDALQATDITALREVLESEGINNIVHIDSCPDTNTLAQVLLRVVDETVRAVAK